FSLPLNTSKFSLPLETLKDIFLFFTEPFISYKIFHYIWTDNFTKPLFLSTKVNKLKDIFLALCEDFVKHFTWQQQNGSHFFIPISHKATKFSLMMFIKKYFLEYKSLAVRKIPLDTLN